MPLLRRDNLLGIFELFSSRPRAFGERDERTLEALVTRTLTNLNRATQPLPAPVQAAPEKQSIHIAEVPAKSEAKIESDIDRDRDRDMVRAPRSGTAGPDFLTLVLGAAVLVCAVMLGVLVGRHFAFQRAARARLMTSTAAAMTARAATSGNPTSDVGTSQAAANAAQPADSGKPAASVVPAGGLQVFENGKEIFSVPPGHPKSPGGHVRPAQPAAKHTAVQRASSVEPSTPEPAAGLASSEPASPDPATIEAQHVVELPPAEVDNNLLSRVEPEYPANARQQKVQGDVVLQVHIGTDGAVEGVDVVSGPDPLVQSSANAVRQWRFKPRVQNGEAVRMQTRVTLNFRLPS
jgi:TonB family protein